MKAKLIRNCIVIGIHNRALSEQLQLDEELTLETAKKRVRQHEAIQEQQATLIVKVKISGLSFSKLSFKV